MNEKWKPIPSFPSYEASSDGRIRNAAGHILSTPTSGRVPYRRVSLGRGNTRLVHRLVAETFLGLTGSQQVRHKDGDATNNRASNLMLGSQAENEQDKREHGRLAVGPSNGATKLNAYQVAAIRKAQPGTVAALAAEYGISAGHAYNLRNGKWWEGSACG